MMKSMVYLIVFTVLLPLNCYGLMFSPQLVDDFEIDAGSLSSFEESNLLFSSSSDDVQTASVLSSELDAKLNSSDGRLPEDFFDYLLLHTGEENKVNVDTPISVGGFLGADHIRLVREANFYSLPGLYLQQIALKEIANIEGFTAQDGVNYEVSLVEELTSDLAPGWKGLKIVFKDPYKDSNKDSVAGYFLPTFNGDILFFAEAKDDFEEESRKKSKDIFDYFASDRGKIESVLERVKKISSENIAKDLLASLMYEGRSLGELNEEEKGEIEEEFNGLKEGVISSIINVIDKENITGFGIESSSVAMDKENLEIGLTEDNSISPSKDNTGFVNVNFSLLPQFRNFNYRNNSFSFNFDYDWDISGAEFKNQLIISLTDSEGREIDITKDVTKGEEVTITSGDINSAAEGTDFNYEVENISIKLPFNVTGVGFTKDGRINSGEISLNKFVFKEEALNPKEIVSIKEKESVLTPMVASLFGYEEAEFSDILKSQNPYKLPYRGIYNEWVNRIMEVDNLYDIVLEAGFLKKNMEFLAEQDGNKIYHATDSEGNDYYMPVSFVEYIADNDRGLLNIFNEEVLSRIALRSGLMDLESLRRIQRESFRKVIEKMPYDERTMSKYDFVKSQIIPMISAYTGYELTEEDGDLRNDVADKGSTFSNALTWLGSGLYEKYERVFTRDEKRYIDRIIQREFELTRERLGVEKLESGWKDALKERVRNNFAVKKVLEFMDIVDEDITLNNFIKWITMDYTDQDKEDFKDLLEGAVYNGKAIVNIQYDYNDLKDIYENLKSQNFIRKNISLLYGKPELTYQQEIKDQEIGDEDFITQTFFENGKDYMLEVYDPRNYLILDSPTASDASIMTIGYGVAYLASLYDKGILEDEDIEYLRELNPEIEDVKDMIKHSMQVLVDIQNKQPDAEWIDNLLGKYPLDMIEKLVSLNKGELAYPSMEELELDEEEYQELLAIDSLDKLVDNEGNWRGWINNYYMKVIDNLNGVDVPMSETEIEDWADGNVFSSSDKTEIEKVTYEQIEAVRKYGWGGWLYHFYEFAGEKDGEKIYQRSKQDTELTPLDTALTAIGFYSAAMMFPESPELKTLAQDFIKNIDMDGIFWNGENRYTMAWLPQGFYEGGYGINGFTPLDFQYRNQEQLSLEFVRALWAELEGFSKDEIYTPLYKDREGAEIEKVSVGGVEFNTDEILIDKLPEFYPAVFGASWVFGLTPIDLRGNDSDSTDWYMQSIMGNLYNRIAALKYNDKYTPYNAQVGSMELLGRGYDMSIGLPPFDPVVGVERPSTIPDGTFSPYSLNLAALPAESLFTLWYQYLTNPRNADGEFGFRASFNRDQNFWASGVYTFDVVTFGINAMNALYGNIWDNFDQDEYLRKTYKRLGYDVDKRLNEYQQSHVSVNEPNAPELGLDASAVDKYDYAESLVEGINEVAQQMVDIDNRKYSLAALRKYMEINDNWYKDASEYLDSIDSVSDNELAVKAKALEFVINKNQYYYEEQKTSFNELVKLIGGQDNLIQKAKDIISKYDYEASVMWKDWDSENQQFIPVLSPEQIEEDLRNPGALPRTACYPELEEYLSKNWQPYTLFPEDAGFIAPYVFGTDKSKGFLDIVREKGWNEAMQVYREEIEIQNSLQPYVKELLGRKLDIMNPDGKDAGFLAGVASEVKGGFTQGKNNRTLDEVIEKLKLSMDLLPMVETLFDYLPPDNYEHDFNFYSERQMGFLTGWVSRMTEKGKSMDEVKYKLLGVIMGWPYSQLRITKQQGYDMGKSEVLMYLPVMKQNIRQMNGAGWVEDALIEKKTPIQITPARAQPVIDWLKSWYSFNWDQIFKAFRICKEYYGIAPDIWQKDTRELHQKILGKYLLLGEDLGYLDKDLTPMEKWRWGEFARLANDEFLSNEKIEEKFTEIENNLKIIVENYNFGLNEFNYSSIEAVHFLLTNPNLSEATGREFEVNKWEIEKQLIKELSDVCREQSPKTHEEKIRSVFTAMKNVLTEGEYGYNLDVSLVEDVRDGKEYGRKYSERVLSIAKFDDMYYCPPDDPLVGKRTRESCGHLNYLYSELYFDNISVLKVDGVRNPW